jgi:hypothetical protein
MQLNRRAVLSGAASLPALSLPALARDPIFAAIDARKATFAVFKAADSDDELSSDACGKDADAIRVMVHTVPTTLAGLLALVRYVVECETADHGMVIEICADDAGRSMDGPICGDRLLVTIATALERLVRSSSEWTDQ